MACELCLSSLKSMLCFWRWWLMKHGIFMTDHDEEILLGDSYTLQCITEQREAGKDIQQEAKLLVTSSLFPQKNSKSESELNGGLLISFPGINSRISSDNSLTQDSELTDRTKDFFLGRGANLGGRICVWHYYFPNYLEYPGANYVFSRLNIFPFFFFKLLIYLTNFCLLPTLSEKFNSWSYDSRL